MNVNIFKRSKYTVLTIILVLGFIMTLTSSVFAGEDNVILFWGDGCPHCEIVKEEIKEKGYDKQIAIDYKEIYYNKYNAELFDDKIKECGISPNNAGVPMVYASGSCWMGQNGVVYAIEKEIAKVEENAQFTPDENEDSDRPDIESPNEHNEQSDNDNTSYEENTDQVSESSKKNTSPLVYITGGIALFFVTTLLIIVLFKLFIKNKHED